MLLLVTHLLHVIAGVGAAAVGALFAAGFASEAHRAPDQP
jgi:hypothetical protein